MIDRFTKVVLTVIAISLVVLAVRSFRAVPVIAEGYIMDIRRVDIVRVGGKPISWRDIQGLVK